MSPRLQRQGPLIAIIQDNETNMSTGGLMRHEISLMLAALLFIASASLIILALSKASYGGLAAAAVLQIISLAWWLENRRA
jgi:hypothetical protein